MLTHNQLDVTFVDVIAASSNGELRRLLAANPSCPARILTFLSCDDYAKVRLGVAENPMTPISTLVSMILNKQWQNPEVIELNSAQAIEEKVEFFRQDDNYDVQVAVAQNPALPLEIIKALAHSSNNDTRRVVAGNSSLPSDYLEQLSYDEYFSVRKACASSPSLSLARLSELAADEDEGVRRNVAGNLQTPARVLRRLAKDESRWVQFALRNNPNLTPSLRRLLHAPVVSEVEFSATVSPILPLKTVILPESPNELVKHLSNLKTSHDLEWLYLASDADAPFALVIGSLAEVAGLPNFGPQVNPLMFAAISSHTPANQTLTILKSKDAAIRLAVTRRISQKCDDPVLIERIIKDSSPMIRKALASKGQSNLSNFHWNCLANDDDDEVRAAVLENMFVPAAYRAIAKLRQKSVKKRTS